MSELEQLPVAIEAEQAVLGGLMLQPEALARIADWVSDADFFREDHRAIYRGISELAGNGKACDAITLGEWFEEQGVSDVSATYLLDLANATPGTANITAWADLVVEKSRLRQLADLGGRMASAAMKPGRSSGDIVAVANQRLNGIAATRSRAGLHHIKPAIKRVFSEMVRRYQSAERILGLRTPWDGLNEFTRGLRDGQLYVLGARPSMGKSIVAGQIAAHAALVEKQRVAFFAVEGSEEEFIQRTVSAFGDIPFDWVDMPDPKRDDDDLYWGRMASLTSELQEAPLLVDDTPYIRIEQLMARARREHQRAPLRLIVVDHLHDMDHGADAKNIRIEIGRGVQGCKTLAKELGCPVVLVAQLNRNIGTRSDKRPTLTDLRESGEIEQKADVIMFLHREDYYDTPDHRTHLQGVVELIPAKGRNLRLGETIYLANRYDRMRAVDWAGPLPNRSDDVEEGAPVKRWRRKP